MVAVSDVNGGIFNGDGIDVPTLIAHYAQHGQMVDFPRTEAISNASLLTLDCDVLVPAALGGRHQHVAVERIGKSSRCRRLRPRSVAGVEVPPFPSLTLTPSARA